MNPRWTPWTLIGLLVLTAPPAAAHEADLPPVLGLQLEPGNQIIHATWEDVVHPDVVGYAVFVYGQGKLLPPANTTQNSHTFAGAINGRVYVVEVAARDAQGDLGPRAAASTQPRLEQDFTYLALGLALVWVAFWGYAMILTKQSREAARRLAHILDERERLARAKPARRRATRPRTSRSKNRG